MIRINGLQDALGDQLMVKIFEVDLWVYVRQMTDISDETLHGIQDVAKRYWPNASSRVRSVIPAERRICYWLLANDRGREVPQVIEWYASVASTPPVRRQGALLLLRDLRMPGQPR